jgi:hypothetical protein
MSRVRKSERTAPGLPLRWAIIVAIAGPVGAGTAFTAGWPAGVGAAVVVAAGLHTLLE